MTKEFFQRPDIRYRPSHKPYTTPPEHVEVPDELPVEPTDFQEFTAGKALFSLRGAAQKADVLLHAIEQALQQDPAFQAMCKAGQEGNMPLVRHLQSAARHNIDAHPGIELYPTLRTLRAMAEYCAGLSVAFLGLGDEESTLFPDLKNDMKAWIEGKQHTSEVSRRNWTKDGVVERAAQREEEQLSAMQPSTDTTVARVVALDTAARLGDSMDALLSDISNLLDAPQASLPCRGISVTKHRTVKPPKEQVRNNRLALQHILKDDDPTSTEQYLRSAGFDQADDVVNALQSSATRQLFQSLLAREFAEDPEDDGIFSVPEEELYTADAEIDWGQLVKELGVTDKLDVFQQWMVQLGVPEGLVEDLQSPDIQTWMHWMDRLGLQPAFFDTLLGQTQQAIAKAAEMKQQILDAFDPSRLFELIMAILESAKTYIADQLRTFADLPDTQDIPAPVLRMLHWFLDTLEQKMQELVELCVDTYRFAEGFNSTMTGIMEDFSSMVSVKVQNKVNQASVRRGEMSDRVLAEEGLNRSVLAW